VESAGVEQGRSGINKGAASVCVCVWGGGKWEEPTIHCTYPKCRRKQAVYHPGGVCEASLTIIK